MKHTAIAMGLAAAIAAAGAVFLHGGTALFSAHNDDDKVGYGLVANIQDQAGEPHAVVTPSIEGETIRPINVASPEKRALGVRPGNGIPVDAAQPVNLDGVTLDALNACATQAGMAGVNGEPLGAMVHDLSAYAACGETIEQKVDSQPAVPVSFAEVEAPTPNAQQWSGPSNMRLRPRFGHALGPAQEAFDLLKPGSAPPASSGVEPTSDYRPS